MRSFTRSSGSSEAARVVHLSAEARVVQRERTTAWSPGLQALGRPSTHITESWSRGACEAVNMMNYPAGMGPR